VAAALAPATPEPSAAASGFRWPVRGRVISGFGKKPDGERNDGINLAVPEGTAVKAAEDGTVIYAGNELKSYGNLVLIRHSNGWVSAYAHNSELQVKRGQEIRRGEIVALSGMSGGVTTPQVHFELRREATPVDPLQHLTES
jgi:murein DD-endopeptidase MepM/ murein hydrolase activator NlpD